LRGFLLLLALVPPPQDDELAVAEAALRRGDYEAASAVLELCAPTAGSEYLWTNLYYDAGLPGDAWDHVLRGLELDGEHLGLLYRATSLALWLTLPEEAGLRLRRLEAAVGNAPLDPVARGEWAAAVEDFRGRVRDLQASEEERLEALSRARWSSAVGILLATGVLAWVREWTRRGDEKGSGPPCAEPRAD